MKYIFFLAVAFCFKNTQAQVFVNHGMIEYEVKVNNHKALGEGMWAEMMRDKFPKLSTSYYQLTFNADKSIYLFNRKDEKTKMPWGNEGEDNVWFNDYRYTETFYNTLKRFWMVTLTWNFSKNGKPTSDF